MKELETIDRSGKGEKRANGSSDRTATGVRRLRNPDSRLLSAGTDRRKIPSGLVRDMTTRVTTSGDEVKEKVNLELWLICELIIFVVMGVWRWQCEVLGKCKGSCLNDKPKEKKCVGEWLRRRQSR